MNPLIKSLKQFGLMLGIAVFIAFCLILVGMGKPFIGFGLLLLVSLFWIYYNNWKESKEEKCTKE